MSYAGPPSQQEINRNRNRIQHNNTYDNSNKPSHKSQKRIDTQEREGGGFGQGGAIMMSYSPPKNRNAPKGEKRNSNKNATQGRKIKPNMTYKPPVQS